MVGRRGGAAEEGAGQAGDGWRRRPPQGTADVAAGAAAGRHRHGRPERGLAACGGPQRRADDAKRGRGKQRAAGWDGGDAHRGDAAARGHRYKLQKAGCGSDVTVHMATRRPSSGRYRLYLVCHQQEDIACMLRSTGRCACVWRWTSSANYTLLYLDRNCLRS